jgi:hypothetical protein
MPLHCREGARSFLKFQEEIVKQADYQPILVRGFMRDYIGWSGRSEFFANSLFCFKEIGHVVPAELAKPTRLTPLRTEGSRLRRPWLKSVLCWHAVPKTADNTAHPLAVQYRQRHL